MLKNSALCVRWCRLRIALTWISSSGCSSLEHGVVAEAGVTVGVTSPEWTVGQKITCGLKVPEYAVVGNVVERPHAVNYPYGVLDPGLGSFEPEDRLECCY